MWRFAKNYGGTFFWCVNAIALLVAEISVAVKCCRARRWCSQSYVGRVVSIIQSCKSFALLHSHSCLLNHRAAISKSPLVNHTLPFSFRLVFGGVSEVTKQHTDILFPMSCVWSPPLSPAWQCSLFSSIHTVHFSLPKLCPHFSFATQACDEGALACFWSSSHSVPSAVSENLFALGSYIKCHTDTEIPLQ